MAQVVLAAVEQVRQLLEQQILAAVVVAVLI
jgi:hypothetical protein